MLISKSQVKYIQSLAQKKFRDAEGVFVVEGPKLASEMLSSPQMRPKQVYAVPEWIDGLSGDLRQRLSPGTLVEIGPAELERLSALTTPNQVVAVFEKPVFPRPIWTSGIHLVLDGVQDPGNLGTIVRLADWFGIADVVASPDSADVFNPKAVQSTMGSIGRVNVWYEDPVRVLRGSKLPVYATVLEGEGVYGLGRMREGFIIIGNESRGIGQPLQELATRRITIPRVGGAESLNAAVATG
ncbi:MAG TPA: RNA methyltransferase, partial [Puia sp.]|nr:RNA methyltransferase [Puia sp.]